MALVLPVLYLGSMYMFYNYIKNKVREYETNQETNQETVQEVDINIDIDIDIDVSEPIYTAVSNTLISVTGPIIVCCTGDMQSMALLYAVINVYDVENINVLFVNNERYNKMSEFVENICNTYHINFTQTTVNSIDTLHCNVEQDIENARRDTINELCMKLGTKTVFEAHTIENQCNNILYNILSGKNNQTINTIKPFANMDMNMIQKFVEKYDIPYDIGMMGHNLTSAVNIFNEFDTVLSSHYPNWRENVINYAMNVSDRLNQFETNIDNITNKCTMKDKFGSYYRYNIDMTSYDLFSNIVNRIADNNNTERPSRYIKTQWYEGKQTSLSNWFCDGHYVVYMNNDMMTHLDNLRTYLDTVNALDYIDDNNNIFNVNLQDDNQYKIYQSNDNVIDYIGDMIKGIIHIEANNEHFSVIELFH
jgi:tRNA(Ile)-lysidine synthase TilS/MesJ